MSFLLKDIYSKEFYKKFTDVLEELIPAFNRKKFIKLIFDDNWEKRELKDRMKHTSFVLHKFMPQKFPEAARLIIKIVNTLEQKGIKEEVIEFMFLPDYIETYGIDYYEESIKTMERVTQLTSCEFAVRPFLKKYKDDMLKQMLNWSEHPNEKVRRLASEGCRPRLPWAMALPDLKKDPLPIIPILENLKNDPSETVRRSVANNLNDISKDNPEITYSILHRWKGENVNINRLIKHAGRTLLKQGNRETLELFGFSTNGKISVKNFKVETPEVKIGDQLEFSYILHNQSDSSANIRNEYCIHFRKANGKNSKKIFKISEGEYAANSSFKIEKLHSFKIITTRKYYTGTHYLSIVINGNEMGKKKFELVD